jgi:KUP system potassium uptake protein
MEAAYGLSITITMLMTTALLSVYLYQKKIPIILIVLMLTVFITIETAFLLANLQKFIHGGWFTIVLGGLLFGIMYIWRSGRRIKNNFTGFVNIGEYFNLFKELHSDHSIPRYATQLVFLTKANRIQEVEMKILYSIFNKQPKRAEVYWLLHVDILDNPYVNEYKVSSLIPGLLFKLDFKLGFKVQPRINLFFRQVVDEMVSHGEIDLTSPYHSLKKYNITGDFRFVLIDRIQNFDFDFSPVDQFIMDQYFLLKRMGISDVKFYGLDSSNVVEETVPLQAETHGAGGPRTY